MNDKEQTLREWAAVEEPHCYAQSDLGKGHIHRAYPSQYAAGYRMVRYFPYVVLADGTREELQEDRNLGGAVWQLRVRLGVDS